ncbi:MAG: acyltransferase [Arcobacteraceae bacterium]|nr:acyltransferase [Arcobacteraceae bacterium]
MNKIDMKNIEHDRVEFLDFLRGMAIFLVFISHTHHLIDINFIHQFGNLFSRGVQLFYIVSGYTIFMIYLDKLNTKEDLTKYAIKRFFRIMPLLYILIPIYYFTFGLSMNFNSNLPDWYHIFAHYSLLFGFHPDTMSSIIAPAWSIFDEFLFYILFAILGLFFSIRNTILKYIFILLSISFSTFLISNIFFASDLIFKTYLFLSPLIQMFIFFVGGIIFIMRKKIIIKKYLLYISSILLILHPIFISSTTLSVYLSVLFFTIILLYLSQHQLNYSRFFLFLGKISFSFYLIHYGVIQIFEINGLFDLNSYMAVTLILLLTVGLSIVSFKYIETSFIHFGKYLIRLKYEK